MIGQTFGLLTVVEKAITPAREQLRAHWLCQCVCGSTKAVSGHHLRGGRTKSCGCIRTANVIAARRAFIVRTAK